MIFVEVLESDWFKTDYRTTLVGPFVKIENEN